MNRILYALLALTLPLFIMTSCGKDDDNEASFSVVGKTYNHRWKSILNTNTYYTYSVRFISNSEYEFAYKKEGEIISIRNSTYSLNYPKIQFKAFGTTATAADTTGVFIDENTFRVGSEEYIRQ